MTLGDIVRHYRQAKAREEWRGDWAMAILYRPPSFVIAWVFLRLGISPLAVTMFGLVCAFLMPVAALLLAPAHAAVGVFLLAVVFQIMDCVDGNVARVSGRVSAKGARLDFLVDMVQWALLYGSIGIIADRIHDTGWAYATLGIAASWLRLYARTVRDTLPDNETLDAAPLTLAGYALAVIAGLSGLIPFLALLAALTPWVVFALVTYSLLDVGDALRELVTAPDP